MAKTTAQLEHRSRKKHPKLGARKRLPYSKSLNVVIIHTDKISESLKTIRRKIFFQMNSAIFLFPYVQLLHICCGRSGLI